MEHISIITVNYRQPEATIAFLESLQQQSFKDYEVVLIDNAPLLDHSADFSAMCPNLKLIINPDNIGFAAANNQGMSVAEGDFFFLLNNDTVVTEGFFETCLEGFNNPKVGALSPLICYYASGERIQYAGFTPLNWRGQNELIGQHQVETGQFQETSSTAYVHGAAMIIRSAVWEKVGGMSEDFFLYYEELAWSEAIRAAGYAILVVPQARIYHKASLSTGLDSPLKLYYLTRNRLLFMQRFKPMVQGWLFISYFFLLVVPVRVYTLWRSKQNHHLRAFQKALFDWFHGNLGYQNLSEL